MAGEIRSFRDPVTNRLKAWGRITANQPGDISQIEAEIFNLDLRTGAWTWNGSAWIAVAQSILDAEAIQSYRATANSNLSALGGHFTLDRAIIFALIDELNVIRAAVPRAIVSITRAGTVATATTADPHGLTNGDIVKVQGATLAPYNVQATVTVTTTTAFTYTVAGSPVTPAVGSISYTMGAVPNMNPRTPAQARNAIIAKIDSGTVDN